MGPVLGGLADHPDFLLYISLAENTAARLFKIFVFCDLGLKNGGPLAAKENCKVFCKPLNLLTSTSPGRPTEQCTSLCRWRRKPREQDAELIAKQQKNKLGRENDPPASNFAYPFACLCYNTALDPSKLGRRAARPSFFAGAFLCVFSGDLLPLRFDDISLLLSGASAASLPARATLAPLDFNAAAASPAARTLRPYGKASARASTSYLESVGEFIDIVHSTEGSILDDI